jgi:hypothetical protein
MAGCIVAGWRFRRQSSRKIAMATKAIIARPPTTPPTIAPMGVRDGVGVGLGSELGLA